MAEVLRQAGETEKYNEENILYAMELILNSSKDGLTGLKRLLENGIFVDHFGREVVDAALDRLTVVERSRA